MLCTEQWIFRFHKLYSISSMDVLLASQEVLCFMELVCVCLRVHLVTVGANNYQLIFAEVAQKGPFLSKCDVPT